jgi:hypothetical protein
VTVHRVWGSTRMRWLATSVLLVVLAVWLIVLLSNLNPGGSGSPDGVPNCPVPGDDGKLPPEAPSFCHP